MSLIDSVSEGRHIGPQINVIAGNNGVGKTTWASSFPSSLVLDLEDGSKHLNVKRISSDKIKSIQKLNDFLEEIGEGETPYKNIVIDSAEALEELIFDFVCIEGKVDSIEKYDGGYGKGYTRSREVMRGLMRKFQELQRAGISTTIVAHTQVKTINDPATGQTYDRVIMRCNDKMAAIIRDLADNVFYATYKVFTTETKGKTRAFGDGQRVMFCQWRPGFDAKNRLELPLELPLSYESFIEACGQGEKTSDETLRDITEMSEKVDEKLRLTVMEQVEKFRSDPTKLREIKNRLQKYVVA